MKPSKNQRTVARPQSYYAWVGVFCVFALVVMGLFYYATQKIEYVWRWNRVPIYFAYKDTIEITSEIDGDVGLEMRKCETRQLASRFDVGDLEVTKEHDRDVVCISDPLSSAGVKLSLADLCQG